MEIKIMKAFSIGNTGGNPAAVVLDAEDLTKTQMQAIAARIGLSETAFVSSSEVADFALNFFTPEKQIAHCGHATIAAFSYLKQTGRIAGNNSSKETIDGIRAIFFEGNNAFMEQSAPVYHDPESDHDLILESLGITANEIQSGLKPLIVNTGNSFLIIPVKDEEVLKRLQPHMETIRKLSEKYNLIGYYTYALSDSGIYDATTRMFAPYYGIEEEAATGMAAGPLACFLYSQANVQKDKFLIEQGKYMHPASASEIIVRVESTDSTINSLFAGGYSYEQELVTLEL